MPAYRRRHSLATEHSRATELIAKSRPLPLTRVVYENNKERWPRRTSRHLSRMVGPMATSDRKSLMATHSLSESALIGVFLRNQTASNAPPDTPLSLGACDVSASAAFFLALPCCLLFFSAGSQVAGGGPAQSARRREAE
eukprot:3576298-Pleurochrysis_carterae.AAC.2